VRRILFPQKDTTLKNNRLSLILILGSLTALGPFSIDMYLPAFSKMAIALDTTVANISLSLSSYFVGISVGQLFYGPLLDRFGRKKPLYVGLSIYLLSTLGCMLAHNIETLIVLRFFQAIGGCAAGVTAMSMVRDLFTARESAKIYSMLMLVLAISPLAAPTFGGFLAASLGWQWVFAALAVIGASILTVAWRYLPETHRPDVTQSLRPLPILRDYYTILRHPQFYTYVLAGAVAFSGLFVYVAGSPIIFMEIFKVSEQVYGSIFAFLAVGMIGASQVNVFLLRRFGNEQILRGALIGLNCAGVLFFVGAYLDWYGMYGTIAILFCFLACIGLSNPNGAAMALAPFAKDAGKAAALMGSFQMGMGALASIVVGISNAQQIFPIAAIFAGSAIIALSIFTFGRRRITEIVQADTVAANTAAH
jgi:drug resistance transporter, Bcr/CflA subfamily